MAKGLRSSTKKTNRQKLKANVFGPVEDARTARLSAKLMELAQSSKPEKTEMDIETEDSKKDESATKDHVDGTNEAMDVDGAAKAVSKSSSSKKKSGRVEKRNRKPRNLIAFKGKAPPGDKLKRSGRRRL